VISETEVKAKTDGELLEIWANQISYVADMVTWVKAEIERRHLDTSGLHVITEEERKKVEKVSSDLSVVRFYGLGEPLLGLSLVFGALELKSEAVFVTGLAVGTLLIAHTVSIWTGKRWAFTFGAIVWSFITAVNILWLILDGLAIATLAWSSGRAMFGSDQPSRFLLLWLIVLALATLVSGGIALTFNRLRKRKIVGDVLKAVEI